MHWEREYPVFCKPTADKFISGVMRIAVLYEVLFPVCIRANKKLARLSCCKVGIVLSSGVDKRRIG